MVVMVHDCTLVSVGVAYSARLDNNIALIAAITNTLYIPLINNRFLSCINSIANIAMLYNMFLSINDSVATAVADNIGVPVVNHGISNNWL
jgi:hypothetical protein